MDQTTKDKLWINVSNSLKMASNYVMAGAGAMFAIWLSLTTDMQQTVIQHLPVPPWLIPILTAVLGIVARLWPQKSITPEIAAAKSDSTPPTPPTPAQPTKEL